MIPVVRVCCKRRNQEKDNNVGMKHLFHICCMCYICYTVKEDERERKEGYVKRLKGL